MRTIKAETITQAIRKLCIDVNYYLANDMYCALQDAVQKEKSPLGKEIIQTIIQNADFARSKDVPICQDTGLTIVFAEIGQDIHIEGDFNQAINKGVAAGYIDGYLRKSVVADPVFDRKNTQDNTPAIIYTDIVPGDKLKLSLAVKGAGSENMGGLKMLKPSDGAEGIINFVVDVVRAAGPNPCPPIMVGVGIGGTMEKATMLSKRALMRDIADTNADKRYAQMEKEMLDRINKTGIGPQGFGGTNTAVAVKIEHFPTHIAQMPVAVNINCHASRHADVEL